MCMLHADTLGALLRRTHRGHGRKYGTESRETWVKLWFFQLLVLLIDFLPSKMCRVVVKGLLELIYINHRR